jgi:hypothetical protein
VTMRRMKSRLRTENNWSAKNPCRPPLLLLQLLHFFGVV